MSTPEAPSLLEELASRFIGSPHGPWGEDHYRASLYAGRLPPQLTLDLPLPPGARLVGGVVRPAPVGAPGTSARAEQVYILVDLAGVAVDPFTFYRDTLPALGWTVAPLQEQPVYVGGFAANRWLPAQAFCRQGQSPWLSVSVIPRHPDARELYITVHTDTPGPCADRPRASAQRPLARLIPPLHPPAGVRFEQRGGGGQETEQSSLAIAYTAMPAIDLERHVAEQLSAAGWTRRSNGADGPLAWSRWDVPGAAGRWDGVLYVFEEPDLPQRRLDLQVRWQPPQF